MTPTRMEAEKRSPFFVYRSTNDKIVFDFGMSVCREDDTTLDRFHFERTASEPMHEFISFLNATIAGSCEKREIKEGIQTKTNTGTGESVVVHRTVKAEILASSNDVDFSTVDNALPLVDVLYESSTADQKDDWIILRIIITSDSVPHCATFRLYREPARITKCQLDTFPMVNCPVAPHIRYVNMCLEKTTFQWYASKTNIWPSEPCHTGLVFTPSTELLHHKLRLLLLPRDAQGRDGIPNGLMDRWDSFGQSVECEWPIAAEPIQPFHKERAMRHPVGDETIRVVSYNILADVYASAQSAIDNIFPQCPIECLTIRYRLPLVLRELLSYKAHIVCLQECETPVFEEYLKSALRYECQMDGLYVPKREVAVKADDPSQLEVRLDEVKTEGCAIFYRTRNFELLRELHLPSILAHSEHEPFFIDIQQQFDRADMSMKSEPEHFKIPRSFHLPKSFAHCLTAAVFGIRDPIRPNDKPSNLMVIGCTHFYFHPVGDLFRYAQARTVRDHLLQSAMRVGQEFGLPVSVILCGDINQAPNGPAYKVLLQPLDKETRQAPITGDVDQQVASKTTNKRQLQLRSTFPEDSVEFTNWVPNFCSILDVILYSESVEVSHGLHCVETLPMCSKESIVSLLKEHSSHAPPTSRGQPRTELDQYALPNAQFPSDHLSLVADFRFTSA